MPGLMGDTRQTQKERMSGGISALERVEGIFRENDGSEESGSLQLKKKAIASPRTKVNQAVQKRKKRKVQK